MEFDLRPDLAYLRVKTQQQGRVLFNQICGDNRVLEMYANSLNDDSICTYFFRKKNGDIYAASDFNRLNCLKRITALSIESDIDCDCPTIFASETTLDATKQSILKLIEHNVCCEAREPMRQIIFDGRTRKLEDVLKIKTVRCGTEKKFYWLQCNDFPVFVIVCVLDFGRHTAVACGVSFQLVNAMSEAYLKAVTELKVKKLNSLQACFQDSETNDDKPSVMERFKLGSSLLAGRLPEDFVGSVSTELRLLQHAFLRNQQQLKLLNLTTPAMRRMGYSVVAANT